MELHVLADERDLDDLAALGEPLDEVVPLAEVGLGRVDPELLADEPVEALLLQRLRDEVDVGDVDGGDDRLESTSAKSAILSRMSCVSGSVERQTSTSGWIPMRRSSFTECWVGFVFSSPAFGMKGTSVTWR